MTDLHVPFCNGTMMFFFDLDLRVKFHQLDDRWKSNASFRVPNIEVSWNRGTPKSSIEMGFPIKNHPAIRDPPWRAGNHQPLKPVACCSTELIIISWEATKTSARATSCCAKLTRLGGFLSSGACREWFGAGVSIYSLSNEFQRYEMELQSEFRSRIVVAYLAGNSG